MATNSLTDQSVIGIELGQSRPTDTTAVSVYSPPQNIATRVMQMVICNTTGSAATARVFIDQDGTTYDQTTALYYDKSIDANDTLIVDTNWWMFGDDGNIAVRTGTGSALTFTFYGTEHQYA